MSGNYYYDGTTGAWRSLSSTVNPIPSTLKNLTVSSGSTTGVSLKVTPFTTSSVNLQEWYNTSSTLVASMNVAGDLTANSLTLTTDLAVQYGGTGAGSFTSGAYLKGAGTAAITAQTGIPAGDVTSGQLAPAQGGVPTGSIMMWYTDTPPTGWLICNGQATTGYTALASVVGATVPNMQQRVPVGKNAGTFATLGATGGAESVGLSISNISSFTVTGTVDSAGSHTHTVHETWSDANTTHNHGSSGGYVAQGQTVARGGTYDDPNVVVANGAHQHTFTSNALGGGVAHNNLQPYIVINYIIKT